LERRSQCISIKRRTLLY